MVTLHRWASSIQRSSEVGECREELDLNTKAHIFIVDVFNLRKMSYEESISDQMIGLRLYNRVQLFFPKKCE